MDHIYEDNYIVASPEDVSMKQLSLLNTDLRGLRIMPANGAMPVGIRAGNLYRMPPLEAADLTALRAEGARVRAEEAALMIGASKSCGSGWCCCQLRG